MKATDLLLSLRKMASDMFDFKLPRIVTDFRHREAYYEWIFPHFRMGFVVDRAEKECGWFLLTDGTPGILSMKNRLDDSLMGIPEYIVAFGQARHDPHPIDLREWNTFHVRDSLITKFNMIPRVEVIYSE